MENRPGEESKPATEALYSADCECKNAREETRKIRMRREKHSLPRDMSYSPTARPALREGAPYRTAGQKSARCTVSGISPKVQAALGGAALTARYETKRPRFSQQMQHVGSGGYPSYPLSPGTPKNYAGERNEQK
jgi:hypothetical protein